MKPIDTLNPAQWHALFQQQTAILANHTRNLAFVQDALAILNVEKPNSTPLVNSLFELHAHLFVLELLLNRSPHHTVNSGTFIGFHTHAAIADVQQSMTHILQNMPHNINSKNEWSSVKETLTYLRQHILTESSSKSYFSEPYFQLLHYLLPSLGGEENLYLYELEQLNAAPAALGPSLSCYTWLLSLAMIHFFLRDDAAARAKLLEINRDHNLPPEEWFRLLTILAYNEEWQRLSEWLLALTPLVEQLRQNNVEKFYHYWDVVITHIPELEQHMWEPLIRSLPSSRTIYQQKLLLHGKWRQWIDYQISTASEPLSFKVGVFAPIEKHDPALLLPYYHQAVERYILLKNRADYKSAVKLLKRLAKLYKKTKNEERWESFITDFASRNSRLRALQEELRKGKLII